MQSHQRYQKIDQGQAPLEIASSGLSAIIPDKISTYLPHVNVRCGPTLCLIDDQVVEPDVLTIHSMQSTPTVYALLNVKNSDHIFFLTHRKGACGLTAHCLARSKYQCIIRRVPAAIYGNLRKRNCDRGVRIKHDLKKTRDV